MKKYYILFIAVLLIVTCVEKPTETTTFGSVHGTVIDQSNNLELAGVTVSIKNVGNRTTDNNGYYEFQDLEENIYTIEAKKTGYVTEIEQVEIEANKNKIVNFTLHIAQPAQLVVSPTSLNFGQTVCNLNISVNNGGDEELSWQVSSDQSWLSSFPTTGTTNTETDEITATVNRAGLEVGNYSGNLSFTSNGGSFNVPVQMEVTPVVMSISPTELDYGESEDELYFTITATGNGDLNWSLTINENWITVNITSGTITNNYEDISVTVNRNELDPDTYEGVISIESNAGNQNVTVNMIVADFPPPILEEPDNITENSMSLTWEVTNQDEIEEYRLYRSENPGVTQNSDLVTTISNPQLMFYNDTDLEDGTTYYYRVYSVSNFKIEVGSNEVNATTTIQLGDWYLNTNLNATLLAVDALDENFAVAVGNKWNTSYMFSYDGNSWIQSYSSEPIKYFGDVKIITMNNIWIAAAGSGLFNFDGITMTNVFNAYRCTTVDAVNENDVWFGYSDYDFNGLIGHYDGNSFTEIELDAATIIDIQMESSDKGWALDEDGKIFYYNGYGWVEQHNGSDIVFNECYAMEVINSSDIWVGGYDGPFQGSSIINYDGEEWVYYQEASKTTTEDIYANNSSSIWFVGKDIQFPYDSFIFYWNGNHLQTITSPSGSNLYGVSFYNPNDGWAVGEDGVVLRYHK